ncbi:MAG: glycosyltransferase family 4 protein [Candidatus Omnitrophota bacterium]
MKKQIKVLFVFPRPQVWGGETVWLQYLSEINREVFSPFIMTFGKGELLSRIERLKIPYLTLREARIRNLAGFSLNFLKMRSFLKKENFDIVNSLGVSLVTAITANSLRIPYILHIHTMHPLRSIDKWCVRNTGDIITVSNFTRDFLLSYGARPENIKVIYNGLDFEEIKKSPPSDLRKELGLNPEVKIVCYIGRIIESKGLDFLARCIPKIKQGYAGKIKFLLVGHIPSCGSKAGGYKEHLLNLAQDLKVKDDIIVMDKREDVAGVLTGIDIFAMPSHMEVTPVAILLAMAASKPVVAIRVGGVAELVSSDTGILIDSKDLDGFSQAITGLLNDEQKCNKLGQEAQRKALDNFSLSRSLGQLEEALRCVYKKYSAG